MRGIRFGGSALFARAAGGALGQARLPWLEVTLAQRDYVLDLPLTDRDRLNAETAAYTEPEYPSSPPSSLRPTSPGPGWGPTSLDHRWTQN
ncbi:MAG: hypothetical protein AB7F50_02885 [Fimbriimonadaceae bacterium]